MPSGHDRGEVGPLVFGRLIVMAVDSALVRKVVKPYFRYIQRAVSATCTSVFSIEHSYNSGGYLQRVGGGNPRTGRNDRIATTTLRK